jgi:hypothetical protein
LWGAAGMILFIPFASMYELIADRSPRLKILSTRRRRERYKTTSKFFKVSLYMIQVLRCKKKTSVTLVVFRVYVCIFSCFRNYEHACFQENVNTN